MAYKVIILYQLYMPSYFLGTFTEYPRAINRTTSPYWRSNTKGFREANDLLAVKILIDRLQIGFQQAAIFFYTVFLDKSLAL